MTIIVTGGAGFIGSALCRHLVANKNQNIIAIDKITYASSEASLEELSLRSNFNLLKVDICDFEKTAEAILKTKPTAIFHLAAESHVDRSINGSDIFVQSNVIGTHNILKAARLVWDNMAGDAKDNFRLLHVSTDEVFGSLGATGKFSEGSNYDPSSPYSATKAAADHLVSAWNRTYELPTLTINCSNNFGPFQNPEKLIPLMIINCLEGIPLPVYGNGMQIRDWIYVEDHVKAMMAVMERGRFGETYCVGGGNERKNIQVVEQICDIVDELAPAESSRKNLIAYVNDRLGHDYRYAVDCEKIKALGWSPEEDFNSGLRRTVSWYLNNKTWWSNFRSQDVITA